MENSNEDMNMQMHPILTSIGDVKSVVVLCTGSHQIDEDEGVEGADVAEIAGAHHSDENT